MHPPNGVWAGILAIAAVVTVAYWPHIDAPAVAGIDSSWQAALHLAALERLHWGSDVSFTYGPLGFLSIPTPYFGVTSLFALVFCFAVYLATVATVFASATRHLPSWFAVLVAIVVGRALFLIPPFEILGVLTFLYAMRVALHGPTAEWRLIAIGGAFVVAVGILGKVNVGVAMAAMAGIASVRITRPWWHGVFVYVGATLAAGAGLWVLAGQNLTDIPPFASAAWELTRGYSEAMAMAGSSSDGPVIAVLVVVGILLAILALPHLRQESLDSRVAAICLVLVFAFVTWKSAIVRADHLAYGFVTALIIAAPLTARYRVAWLRGMTIATVAIATFAVAHVSPMALLGVAESANSLTSQATRALIPGNQDEARDQTRQELVSTYSLPEAILSELDGHTVHVEWWEAAVAFAYPQVRWRPLPMFQAYAAFTPALDQGNVARLRDKRAPERILREHYTVDGLPAAVDGRNRWFESPATILEQFCRYTEVAATERWQVLARTEAHCGIEATVRVVRANLGESVAVPIESRPDRFLIVRITGIGSTVADRLQTAFGKGSEWMITLDSASYRLVPATATEGLLLRIPPSIIASRSFDFGGPTKVLSVENSDGTRGSEIITYEFVSVQWLPEAPVAEVSAEETAFPVGVN